MSRRLVVTLAAAAALLSTAAPAGALSPTVYPTATTPTLPGTSPARVADAWKLVGKGTVSAIQIAPRWVLSADHMPAEVGVTFSNSYGSAVVEKKYRPAIGYHENNDFGTDLALSYLATPITLPAGVQFPKLLDDEVDSTLEQSIPGWILNAGLGNDGSVPVQGNTPNVGIASPWGTNPAGTSSIFGVTGDSGGAQYWYPSGTAQPVLAGVLTRGTITSLSQQQSIGGTNADTHERVRDFLDAAFAEKAGQPNATPPTFTRITSEVGGTANLRPAPVASAWSARTSAISIRPEWNFPLDSPNVNVQRAGVRVYLNGELKATLGPNVTTTVLTNLQWLKKYTVRIVAFNAAGEAIPSASDTFVTTTIL